MNNDVFAKHPIIKDEEKNAYLRSGKFSRPVMLMCETVNICNNSCIVCAYSKMTRPKEVMAPDVFRKVLDDYSDMGGGGLSLTPVVGDVFLDPMLTDRVFCIEQYDNISPVSITTNAINVDKFSDDDLARIVNFFGRINVSMYGLDDLEYKAMTRRKFYRKAVAGIKRLLSLLEDKEKLVLSFRLLKKRDNKYLENWIYDNFGDRVEILNSIDTYSNWGVLDDSRPLPYDAKWLGRRSEDIKKQCLIPLVAMQVFSNGNVSFCPCDDFNNIDELHLGSVNNETLLGIYNSEKVSRLWDFNMGTPLFCQKCSFFIPLDNLNDFDVIFQSTFDFVGG